MKIHILSDLHLEFSHFQASSASNLSDVIILAGDIGKGDRGIYWAREQWPTKPIIYVSGNHEYYGKRRGDVMAALRIAAKATGVHFLNDEEVVIDGIRVLGSTLWTDFKLFGEEYQIAFMRHAINGLNDFRVIFEGEKVFSPTDALELFEKSVLFLHQKLIHEQFDGKTVVVTHHLPSRRSVAERYMDDKLSACFASNLDYLLGNAVLWAHGHTHDPFDYLAGKTRVICNPRGYVLYGSGPENIDFDPELLVEI